jgi:hypothetical protein
MKGKSFISLTPGLIGMVKHLDWLFIKCSCEPQKIISPSYFTRNIAIISCLWPFGPAAMVIIFLHP